MVRGELLQALYIPIMLAMMWIGGSQTALGVVVLWFEKSWQAKAYGRIDKHLSRLIPWMAKSPLVRGIDLASMLDGLALASSRQGQYDRARDLLVEAVRQSERDPRFAKHPYVSIYYAHLAWVRLRLGNYDDAIVDAEHAIAILQDRLSVKYGLLKSLPVLLLSNVHLIKGELTDAEITLEETRKLLQLPVPPRYSDQSFVAFDVFVALTAALLRAKQGRFEESTVELRKAIALAPGQRVNTSTLFLVNEIASQFIDNELYSEAEVALSYAYPSAGNHPFSPDSQRLLAHFERLLESTNRADEVNDMRQWLRTAQ